MMTICLGLITDLEVYYDPLQFGTLFPIPTTVNVTKLCQSIQVACVGSNQEYNSVQDCITFISALPMDIRM